LFSPSHSRIATRLAAMALLGAAIGLAATVPASAADAGAFSCASLSGGSPAARGTVYSIRYARHAGFDRLVFGFPATNSMPAYRLTPQASSTFVRDPSGLPGQLAGTSGIKVVFQNADVAAGVPSDSKADLPQIAEVAKIGDFERVVSYGVGLRSPTCFRVSELTAPTRLVIDVATPAVASATTQAVASATSDAAATRLAATGHPTAPQATPVSRIVGLSLAALGLGVLTVLAAATLRRRQLKRR